MNNSTLTSTESSTNDVSASWFDPVWTDYVRVCGVVTSLLGLIGNYLCFITAAEMPQSNGTRLMRHLAVWDSLAGVINGIVRMGFHLLGIAVVNLNRVTCKLVLFLSYSFVIVTTYLLVAMATDRFLAIKFPIFHRNYSSKRIVNIAVAVIITMSFVVILPAFYFQETNDEGVCVILPKAYPTFHLFYSFFVSFIVFFGLPFALVFSTNLTFVISLAKRRYGGKFKQELALSAKHEEMSDAQKQKFDAERDYVIMLLMLTLSFLLFTLASGVFIFWSVALSTAPESQDGDLIEFAGTMNTFANIMNNSLNFMFYFIGGRMFRESLIKKMKMKFSRAQ